MLIPFKDYSFLRDADDIDRWESLQGLQIYYILKYRVHKVFLLLKTLYCSKTIGTVLWHTRYLYFFCERTEGDKKPMTFL